MELVARDPSLLDDAGGLITWAAEAGAPSSRQMKGSHTEEWFPTLNRLWIIPLK